MDLMGCLSSKVTNSYKSDYDDDEDDDDDFSEVDDESDIKSGSGLIAGSEEGLEGYRVHWDDEFSEEYIPGFSSRPTTGRSGPSGVRRQSRSAFSGLSSEYVLEE